MVPGSNVGIDFDGERSGCDEDNGKPCISSESIGFVASGYGYDFGCAPHAFVWDFADGQQATGNNVTHVFSRSNTYEVTLTIANWRQTVQLRKTTTVVTPRRRPSGK